MDNFCEHYALRSFGTFGCGRRPLLPIASVFITGDYNDQTFVGRYDTATDNFTVLDEMNMLAAGTMSLNFQ
jgi:hypothetical protein